MADDSTGSTLIVEHPVDTNSIEASGQVESRNADVEMRVAEAWNQLAAAELAGSPRRKMEALEAAYYAEVAACQAALAHASA